MQSLEAEVARMRSEAEATQQTVAALQARVRQAEQARYRNVLVYILAATTLLGVLVAALLWWLRPRQRRQRALVRGPGQPAGPRRRPRRSVDLGRAGLAAGAAVAAGGADAAAVQRPATLAGTRVDLEPPVVLGMGTGSGSLMPTTQHSSIGGLEVTTVLGPELSRSSVEAFGGSAARALARRRAHAWKS